MHFKPEWTLFQQSLKSISVYNTEDARFGHSFLIFSFTGPRDPKFAVFEMKINFLLIFHYIYAYPFFGTWNIKIQNSLLLILLWLSIGCCLLSNFIETNPEINSHVPTCFVQHADHNENLKIY